jgi:putative ABC transport system permease protein
MIRNYILTGWRSLLKNRLFSFINIFGLALSMSVCMIVLMRIIDNFGYDTFHPYPDQTYRILSGVFMKDGNKAALATTPMPLKETLNEDRIIIREVVRVYPALRDEASDGVKAFDIHGAFTEPAFFNVFGFTLQQGDIHTALRQPNSIVLSQAVANKFFGTQNPLGKILTLKNLGAFQITGVMEPPLAKSHLQYDAYASASSIAQLEKENRLPSRSGEWDTFEHAYTYVLLQDGVPERFLEGRLDNIATMLNKESEQAVISFSAQSISSITPGWTELYHETSRGSSWGKLIAEISIALIILVSACFNYTNLSIARALTRGKEVGIRKLSGAARWQIFAQYITESIIIALFALSVAQVFLAFILEYQPFNKGYEMVPAVRFDFKVLSVFLVFTLVAGLMAGAMPAWILSSFTPLKVLRGSWSEKIMGNLSMRKALMVFQFSLSLVILIFLTAFYQQFEFMASADGGFERRNIVVIPLAENHQRVDAEFSGLSGVESVAHTSNHFGRNPSGKFALYENKDLRNYHQLDYYFTDAEYIEMMGLNIVAGHNFSCLGETGQSVLINEKAAQLLGFEVPADAVGSNYYLSDSTRVEVKGVVKDFYHRSVGHQIIPLVFRDNPTGFGEILVKVAPSAQATIADQLTNAWRKIYPDQEFRHEWLDKKIGDMNTPAGDISFMGFLAFMTVTIAVMGLLGLVVYTVETRRKEISIRKIVGASVSQVMILLSTGYTRLLIIAGLIAIPTGYALSQFFLLNFVNRISFGIPSLVFSFALLLMIGLVTILSQTFRAARENPARNLKSE